MTSVEMEDKIPNKHLPRRLIDHQVPMSVMLVVCIQIVTCVWFFSAQNSTIKQLSDHSALQDLRIDKIDDRTLDIEKSVAILKDRSDDNLATSHRIEEYLHSFERHK